MSVHFGKSCWLFSLELVPCHYTNLSNPKIVHNSTSERSSGLKTSSYMGQTNMFCKYTCIIVCVSPTCHYSYIVYVRLFGISYNRLYDFPSCLSVTGMTYGKIVSLSVMPMFYIQYVSKQFTK